MNLNDITRKAHDFLKSEKGEEVSDKILDSGAKVANRVAGAKHAEEIQKARDTADKHVGRDDNGTARDTTPEA
jgi:basic membrane lipoprotein Med (substrate-binding protein (PBP1-ABC) superfamily)